MNDQTQRTDFHEVRADQMPDDTQRICPLIGNDELKLCVDARGVMHDFSHEWSSHPPARITWSGRRHDRRYDRYNSNLFEWGFLDLHLAEEDGLPAVTNWRQRLHPREGYVETEITRGDVVERTISFVHLEKNVIVFRREYDNLPAEIDRRLTAQYTLCHVGTEELPFRVDWTPKRPFTQGICADTTADGMWQYRGRIALFADVETDARAVQNRLELDAPLPSDDAVTICLSLNDDLGDHPQIMDIQHAGWMTDPVKEVHAENQRRLDDWEPADYETTTKSIINDLNTDGFTGLFNTHKNAWSEWFSQAEVELPDEEDRLSATLDTQLYTMRCCYTRWSSPANPFNTSWGAPYFWDERFPTEGLMRLGIMDMPTRTAEWRRTILPFSTMMSGGRGARYVPSAVEPGSQIADRNATQYYEFFTIGVVVNYLYEYCNYFDNDETWKRYYPIFRECAEFFRRYLLIELPGNNIMVTWLVDVNETYYPVQDGPFTTCGAARIFHAAIETARRLDIDEPHLDEWEPMRDKTLRLANHLCGGGTLERDTEKTTADNPATPYIDYELDDLPVRELEVDETIRQWRDEYRERNAPENQMEDEKTNIAGESDHLPFWSWGPLQAAHSAAMQDNPEKALDELRRSLTTLMDFGALNESAQTDLTDVHHPWFNTGAGAYVRALARMLLYPKEGEIRLLPGIPPGWKDLAFTMPVYGDAEISVKVHNGEFTSVILRNNGEEQSVRRIRLPNRYLGNDPKFNDAAEIAEKTEDHTTVTVPVTDQCAIMG